MVLVQKTLI